MINLLTEFDETCSVHLREKLMGSISFGLSNYPWSDWCDRKANNWYGLPPYKIL